MPAPPPKKALLSAEVSQFSSYEDATPGLTGAPGLRTIQARHLAENKPAPNRRSGWIVVAVGALLFGLLVRVVATQAIYTTSSTMDPALKTGDRFYVNKMSYWSGSAQRGDIVVVERTPQSIATDSEAPGFLVRRVVAIAGETVEAKDDALIINGVVVAEPYLDPGTFIQDFEPVTVPDDAVLVLSDSRRELLGMQTPRPTPTDEIVGTAMFVYWPRSSIGSP